MDQKSNNRVVEVRVRRATTYDFVNILRLCEDMLKEDESIVAYPPFDADKAMQTITDCKRFGEVLVADCSRQLVGAIGLLAREWQWSRQRFVTDEFFFVLPKFRKRGTANALLKAAESFADGANTPLVVAFSGGKNADIKDRMMGIKGYTYCGGVFYRPPRS